MTETLFKLLRANIARVLQQTKPWLADENELFDMLRPIPPKMIRSDFDYVIGEMATAGQLLRQRGDRNVVKCKLTEVGEAELLCSHE